MRISRPLPTSKNPIANFAARARAGSITMEELTGGTFTITNGGTFGSLLSTPIVNAPQSAILGMHKIQDRPVVVDGQIVIRPMMYIALTYDHRIIDGREAVQIPGDGEAVSGRSCAHGAARMSDAYDVIVIGGGPAGYPAAIRAGQNKLKVACIDEWKNFDGTYASAGPVSMPAAFLPRLCSSLRNSFNGPRMSSVLTASSWARFLSTWRPCKSVAPPSSRP